MSPRIRLVCYPSSDPSFAEQAALHLAVDIPDDVSVDEMVGAVQGRLRERHPQTVILLGEDDGQELLWHVYRDGV